MCDCDEVLDDELLHAHIERDAAREEVERLRPVLIAAQELLACGIINPTGWAKLDEAEAALGKAIQRAIK